jgi:gas vesicle protein
MVKQRRSTGRGFLLGLIIGLVAGAVLALIFTPSPGEGDYADVVRKRYGDAIEQSKDAYARARDEVLSRYSRAKAGDFSAQ